MKKLLGIVVLSLMLSSTHAYAICILGIGNCEAEKRCKEYAKNSEGNRSDAYNYCMERENNIKDYGDPLDEFIKQNE